MATALALLSISLIPRRVAAATGQPAPSPRKVYEAVLRGLIPAEMVNGRWVWDPADLPEIIDALGLASAPSKVAA